jgi:lipopolysaccharide transport system permease protein
MPRVVYTPQSETFSPKQVLPAMVRGLIQSRYMAIRLVVKDIKSDYSKSQFGMIWELIDPLVLGFIFYALMRTRVFTPGETNMPYAIFIIYGLLMYATFVESVMRMVNLVKSSKSLLSQLKLPPEALILSVLFRIAFNCLFRLLVMLFFSLLLRNSAMDSGMSAFSLIGFIKFLFLFPSVILIGAAIGLFCAPLNAIYSDVGTAIRIGLGPYRYLSPVLWPLPLTGTWAYVHAVSPISPLFLDLRMLATNNIMDYPGHIAARVVFFGILFLFSWFIFHVSIIVLSEKV